MDVVSGWLSRCSRSSRPARPRRRPTRSATSIRSGSGSNTGREDIDGQLEASVTDWRNKAREMEKELDTLASELENQRLLLSEEAATQKEQTIREKRRLLRAI